MSGAADYMDRVLPTLICLVIVYYEHEKIH